MNEQDDLDAAMRELLVKARRAADPPSAVSMRVQARLLAHIGPPAIGLGASGAAIVSALKLGTLAAVTIAIGLHVLVGVARDDTRPAPIDPPAQNDAPAPARSEGAGASNPGPQAREERPPLRWTAPVRTTADAAPLRDAPIVDAQRRSTRRQAERPQLAAELASLAAVNDALARGAVRKAATHLRTHRRRFADGQMRSEAMVLEILVAAASRAPVTARCERFADAHPGSVHDRRIASICR